MDEFLVDILRDDHGTVRLLARDADEAELFIQQALDDPHVVQTAIRVFRLRQVEYRVDRVPRVTVLDEAAVR